MLREPNMRVEVTVASAKVILANGGCIAYCGTPNACTVWAEGKPGHLERLIELNGVTAVGEIEKVPTYTQPSGSMRDDS